MRMLLCVEGKEGEEETVVMGLRSGLELQNY